MKRLTEKEIYLKEVKEVQKVLKDFGIELTDTQKYELETLQNYTELHNRKLKMIDNRLKSA